MDPPALPDDKDEVDEDDESVESINPQDKDDAAEDHGQDDPGKYYLPRTQIDKAVAKMLVHFYTLLQCDANFIVVYFGMSSKKKLANFQPKQGRTHSPNAKTPPKS